MEERIGHKFSKVRPLTIALSIASVKGHSSREFTIVQQSVCFGHLLLQHAGTTCDQRCAIGVAGAYVVPDFTRHCVYVVARWC